MRVQKRRRLGAPFLVTIAKAAAAAVLVPACAGEVITNPPGTEAGCPTRPPTPGDDCRATDRCTYARDPSCTLVTECITGAWRASFEGICAAPPPECPKALPGKSTPCYEIGAECTYPLDDGCGGELLAMCNAEAKWEILDVSPPCNPPACPADVPTNGAPCDLSPACTYAIDVGCGPESVDAECVDEVWQVEPIGTCNPPPPDPCVFQPTEIDCVMDPSCQWLVPGCGMSPLSAAGCFSKTACVTSADCGGAPCVTVNVDPCWNDDCAQCSADVQVCQP